MRNAAGVQRVVFDLGGVVFRWEPLVLLQQVFPQQARNAAGAANLARAEAVKAETGQELKIKLVDKAAMDRSGAVAQGLSAINTYIGSEQDPADYARMVSNDLMGITRDDLAYDLGRHVDESVHLFEEWGLPIWKTDAPRCAAPARTTRKPCSTCCAAPTMPRCSAPWPATWKACSRSSRWPTT